MLPLQKNLMVNSKQHGLDKDKSLGARFLTPASHHYTCCERPAERSPSPGTIRGYSGHQPGDPARAAQAIVQAVESDNPPLRLLLGKGALNGARAKLDALKKDFDAWEETTVWADAPKSA